jgi:hypothetical protein
MIIIYRRYGTVKLRCEQYHKMMLKYISRERFSLANLTSNVPASSDMISLRIFCQRVHSQEISFARFVSYEYASNI